MEHDLYERILKYSKNLIIFINSIKITFINKNLIEQLLRSWTSVWANYSEANGAMSKNDFKNKIHIARKEIQETYYWLELLKEMNLNEDQKNKIKSIIDETNQLTKIFNKITHTLRNK